MLCNEKDVILLLCINFLMHKVKDTYSIDNNITTNIVASYSTLECIEVPLPYLHI